MNSTSKVSSELLSEGIYENIVKLDNSNHVVDIKFVRSSPSADVETDEDGDLLVARRREETLTLELSSTTSLALVGLQIWRGAFLLSDFILAFPSVFEGKTVLELGAGTGLTSIVVGLIAKKVITSDRDHPEVLSLLQRNVNRNGKLLKAQVDVLPLDFLETPPLGELSKVEVIIAADVIYDDSLSEAFVNCLTQILLQPPSKVVYLALEKRYVFTLDDLCSVPPCYDYFWSYLKSHWSKPPMSSFRMELLDCDFPQFFNYERNRHLVLWKLTSSTNE